jgi:pimeloyl-ACP methyl ester carboxylesterase
MERNADAGEFSHRMVATNGIQMHIAEAGAGPLVLLLHGFPEGWYSWRHQLRALAGAGFHAVAPDQRGYGRTDQPADIGRYSMFHLVGDVIGLVDALGERETIVVGHDWGANVAWNSALFRPDLVRAVAALSVPVRPRISRPPLDVYRETAGPGFYQLYFQEPGVAEREFDADVRRTLLAFLCSESGEASHVPDFIVGENGLLETLEILDPLPTWLSEADVEHWTEEFSRTGFAGALNWYRNVNTNWELLAPWAGAKVSVPALYVVGDRDDVFQVPGLREYAEGLKQYVPNLSKVVVLEGCGQWTQQERPNEVNDALLEFLSQLGD